uniref:Glucosidase 2 subunit beta n=1 Tax=Rhabditophanes sp. KR3021 TaxID=114890 RepID=A0AC35U0V9_9BILA
MVRYSLIYLSIALLCSVTAKETGRPLGVSPQDAPFYDSSKDFQCRDGSKNIPFDSVNDNYCDCDDGSDEPSTGACPDTFFYCSNDGFRPENIPSSRVGDTICDCCSGEDEPDTTNCPNICDELGKNDRVRKQERLLVITSGYAKRLELAAEGLKMWNEKTAAIDATKETVDALRAAKTLLEAEKAPLEEKENELKGGADKLWDDKVAAITTAKAKKLFKILDVDEDNKITIPEIMVRKEADGDENGETSEDEAKIFLNDLEEVDFETFKSQLYDSFKYKLTEHNGQDEEIAGEEQKKDEEEVGEKPEYDQVIKDAIAAADQIREKVREINDKINSAEDADRDNASFLKQDFGEDKSWGPLYKKCFEYKQKQYVYKLCLFDKTSQKDSNGYSETSLGNWENWSTTSSVPHTLQSYTHGQGCWNGPDRSTKVVIECGNETELVDASEPAKCEYQFTLVTPAVCPNPATIGPHDEL